MTLQEAITHIEDILQKDICEKCKEEHRELKEFLLELQERRNADKVRS